ncbi:hypothetical protein WJ972_15500 [Achromobacter insuavis]
MKVLCILVYYAILVFVSPLLGIAGVFLLGGLAQGLALIAMLWTMPFVLCLARHIQEEKRK